MLALSDLSHYKHLDNVLRRCLSYNKLVCCGKSIIEQSGEGEYLTYTVHIIYIVETAKSHNLLEASIL